MLLCCCASLLAAISYGAASLAMVFLNKGVLMVFKYSLTLLTLQVSVLARQLHCPVALLSAPQE